MVDLRATDKTDEIDIERSNISIAEEGNVIFDFVHIDGKEHTVVLPRELALQLADMILGELENPT